jgi:DNA mismatch endonuclease (patch repair protein)
MSDTFTPEERSRIMSRIRSRGNRSTELRFVRLLKQHRLSGWRRKSTLPGKPDFIFPRQRVAIFIDGDFWHGNPRSFRIPKSNVEYWGPKIQMNRRRDLANNRRLRDLGWRVQRFWESELRNEAAVVAKLKRILG